MTNTFDPFDELAAMFLTTPSHLEESPPIRSGRSASGPREHRATTCRELLMVGNLPVRSGLWLTPYADAVARELGPVGLIRLDTDPLSLQVLRGPEVNSSLRSTTSIPHAVEQVGHTAAMWIIRPPSDLPVTELLESGADRITILTSGDEAAVVAAYQMIKVVAQSAENAHAALPPIGLAIVGEDRRNAAAVIERLNRTTVSFLGVEVRLVLCLPSMDAGVQSTCYLRFPVQSRPALGELISYIDRASRLYAAPSGDHREREEQPRRTPTAEVLDAERILRMPSPAAPHAAPREPHPAPSHPEPPHPAPSHPVTPHPVTSHPVTPHPETPFPGPDPGAQPSVKLSPKATIDVEPKEPVAAQEPDDHGRAIPLAQFVTGLMPMPVRCPGHERVELAVDSSGGLHLLGRESTLRDMRFVECWAKAHRELISLACPHHPLDPARKTICHLFTDQPVTVADLHGADVFLHVLTPVTVEGKTGWYAAPLNVPAAFPSPSGPAPLGRGQG